MDEGTAVDVAAAHETGETVGGLEEGFFYCSVPEVPEPELDPNMAPSRFELIQLFRKKWVNGTVLRYYFFDEETDGEWVQFTNGTREWRSWVGPEAQREVVRRAFQVWKEVGIGLEFKEVQSRDEAEIRIGFMRGDGAWSIRFTGADDIGGYE